MLGTSQSTAAGFKKTDIVKSKHARKYVSKRASDGAKKRMSQGSMHAFVLFSKARENIRELHSFDRCMCGGKSQRGNEF